MSQTPGLYAGPGVYPVPGFYPKFYGNYRKQNHWLFLYFKELLRSFMTFGYISDGALGQVNVASVLGRY